MRRTVLLLASMALALLLAGGVAQAIINGQPDTGPNAHPYVGALVSVPPSGQFKGQRIRVCSGTLLSARVFLTAGHCTDALIKEELPTYVSFDPTYKSGASKVISATPHTHPQYDVGVAVLEEPVRMATYGALPAKAGLVDTLKEGQRLTVVGYGVSGFDIGSEPLLQPQPVLLADRSRATVRLLHTKDPDVGDQYVKTTGIGIIGGRGEGSCYGDSGGPLFISDQQTIVGVTSRGIAPLCRGPGYYQRTDLPSVLKWVRSFP
jgi:secreted trypsin-like serine protease